MERNGGGPAATLLTPPKPGGALRSHIAATDEDVRAFAVPPLASVPSTAAGAPASAEESRETLARLKRMAGFEAQDFDPPEHDVERTFRAHRTEREYGAEEAWRWALAAAIGVAMGVCGFGVDWGIGALNDVKFRRADEAITASGGGFWRPAAVFVGTSAGFGAVAGGLVSFVSPLAAGSGIAEIKTYLNGIHIRGLLTIRTLFAKLAGVVFAISAGLVAGKEGPFVHGGAVVGGGLAGMGSQTLTDWARAWWPAFLGGAAWRARGGRVAAPRWAGGYFRNDADHRDFVAIGTAAGVATAFAAPIGGLLFTIEEGASFYSTSIFWRGFLATGAGVLTLHALVEAAEHPSTFWAARFGRYRDFGLYADSLAFYGSRMFYYVWDVPIFCAMGCIGGAAGAAFVHLNVKVTAWRHAHIPAAKRWTRVAEAAGLAAVTAALWFLVAYTSPCAPLPPPDDLKFLEASEDADEALYGGGGTAAAGPHHYPRLWCEAGSYAVHGQLFFAPLSQALRLVVHLGEPLPEARLDAYGPHPLSLALLAILGFGGMVLTNGVGASTGMFVPALAVGAAGGRLVGLAVRAALRASGSTLPISMPAYAVVGAAGFMGGATRMTLTATVMVMETTGALQLIVPLIATVFCAKVVGDLFGAGVDDTHVKIRGAPVLDEPGLTARQKMVADKLTVGELAAAPVVVLPPVVPVARLLAVLQSCNHQAFPVSPDAEDDWGGSGGHGGGGGGGGGLDRTPPQAGRPAGGGGGAPPSPTAPPGLGRFAVHGLILRDVLLRLLETGLGRVPAGADPPAEPAIPPTQAGREAVLAALERRPVKLRPGPALASAAARLAGCTESVDLRPFMQRHPFVIPADASLARAYRLFRTLGLRHMLVTPACPPAVGLVTRKDLCEANARLALGAKAVAGLATVTDRLVRPGPLPFIPYEPYGKIEDGGAAGWGLAGAGGGGGGGGGGGAGGGGGGGGGHAGFASSSGVSPGLARAGSGGLSGRRRAARGSPGGPGGGSGGLAAGGGGGGSMEMSPLLAPPAPPAAAAEGSGDGEGGSGGGGGGPTERRQQV